MATATHLITEDEAASHPQVRSRRRPFRGRQRRRHAAHRRPVHPLDGARRQRPRDLPGFPGRDPRSAGHDVRRQRLPDQLRLDLDRDRGRPAGRADRDEPGGAEGERRPASRRRADHRRRGRVHRAQPRQGGLRAEPARGRQPRQVAARPLQHLAADARCREAVRPRQQGGAALQEHVDAGARALDVRPRPPADRRLAQGQVRQGAGACRGEHRRAQRRPCLWRDGRDRRPFTQHHIAPAPAEPGLYRTVTGAEALALGPRRGRAACGPADVLRRLSDHAGQSAAAPSGAAEGVRDHDLPGGGRDRGDLRGDRRVATPASSASPRRRARASRSRPRRSASRS